MCTRSWQQCKAPGPLHPISQDHETKFTCLRQPDSGQETWRDRVSCPHHADEGGCQQQNPSSIQAATLWRPHLFLALQHQQARRLHWCYQAGAYLAALAIHSRAGDWHVCIGGAKAIVLCLRWHSIWAGRRTAICQALLPCWENRAVAEFVDCSGFQASFDAKEMLFEVRIGCW